MNTINYRFVYNSAEWMLGITALVLPFIAIPAMFV
jgi:hypothetical protein